MRRLVTVSYTGLDAGGGVPKFNRDLHASFPERECRHFCWDDCPHDAGSDALLSEWQKARVLNQYLLASRKVRLDDVVVADGFWADGLDALPFAISHSHGIWSHLTHEDVLAGREPDMPLHHAAQVSFRRRWTKLGKRITAVSDFIAEQMRLQWGFAVNRVINNGVDTTLYRPREYVCSYLHRPLILHGVNDRSNLNKGWDHIELLQRELDADVLSLDEAYGMFQLFSDRLWTKPEVLSQANLIVHPSAFEGNSMFVAEGLACGVPVVGYDVGYLWSVPWLGTVIDRKERKPGVTLEKVRACLADEFLHDRFSSNSRMLVERDLSSERFCSEWRSYVEEIERVA